MNNNILPGTFTKEQRSTGLGITMTHHVHPAAGVPHFKSNNVNLVKAPATMLRATKKGEDNWHGRARAALWWTIIKCLGEFLCAFVRDESLSVSEA